MKVGKKLAAGIETGQETAASAKETVGMSFLLCPLSSASLFSLLPPSLACLHLPHTNRNTTKKQPRTSHPLEKSRERQRKLGNPPTRV